MIIVGWFLREMADKVNDPILSEHGILFSYFIDKYMDNLTLQNYQSLDFWMLKW